MIGEGNLKDYSAPFKDKCVQQKKAFQVSNMDQKKCIEERKKSEPSAGEKKVMKYLRKHHVKFKREHYFQELVNNRTGYLLFFDFYVKDLNLVIEVDGKQHFVAIHGKQAFNRQVHCDKLKNRFCEQNGINICRLTYEDLKTMDKLKYSIANCVKRPKVIEKKKELPSVVIKPKEKKPRNIIKYLKEKRAETVGKRVAKKQNEWMEEAERKRQEARLNYPTDIRIYLAEKNK